MKENLFTDIFRIDNIKIRNKKLLNQLSSDEILYLHLNLTIKDERECLFKDLDFPISYEEFECVKKQVYTKKVRKENLIDNILNIIAENQDEEESRWFKVEIFKNPEEVDKYNDFYSIFYKFLSEKVLDEFKSIKTNMITEYTSKLSSYGKDKKPELDCIKSICSMCLAEMFLQIQDGALGEAKPKRTTKKMEAAVYELQQQLAFCVHNNYTLVCKDTIDDIENQMLTLKDNVKKGMIQIEDKNIKIKELKENLRSVTKQLKDFQKIVELTTLEDSIKDIYSKLDSLEKANEVIAKEMKITREDSIRKIYEKQIDGYVTRLSDVKRDLSLKSIECKDLKKVLDEFEKNIEGKFICYVEANGLSDKMIKFLTPLLSKEENLMEAYLRGDFSIPESVEQESEMVVAVPQPKYIRKIGYVEIEDNKHYVVFPNGMKAELGNINDRIYFAEGQFIIVDENNDFIKTTLSKYEDNGISIRSLNIGTIETLEPLVVKIGNELVDAKNSNGFNGYYNLNQVVGLNEYNQIVRAFRLVKFNADTVMASVKARGLKMYYVLNVYNGYLSLRNIETGEEGIHQIELGDIKVNKSAILFVRENKAVNALGKGQFYTSSSYYNGNVSFGPVSIVNGVVILKKQCGKSVIVENIPEHYTIKEGEVVYIDEFNNYMHTLSTDRVFVEKSISKKTAKQIIDDGDAKKTIVEKGKVVIVGNPYYKNSYIMSFYKHGYKVSVLHGYDSTINKIVQEAKDSLAIIVNTSYCSHDNFWQIKDEVKGGQLDGIRYVFTQEDGANMLLHKFNELFDNKEIAIVN